MFFEPTSLALFPGNPQPKSPASASFRGARAHDRTTPGVGNPHAQGHRIGAGWADKQQLSKALHRQYLRVFPKVSDRHALLKLGQSLLGSSYWYDAQLKQRDKLAYTEMLILWGEKDRFLPVAFREKWQAAFPQAITHRFGCGHFVQEEAAAASIAAMKPFFTGG